MQKFVWWVWGLGSGATARRYHETCLRFPQMMESDFSKYDASMGPFWLWFNREFLYRLFLKHLGEIDKLLSDSEWQRVLTTCGLHFDYGSARFTGVNETALFNTLDQAFVQYVSHRLHSCNHDEAIRFIEASLFGGDDGITPFVGQDLPATAARFGMKVTYRVFDSDSPCRFLGRIYLSGSNTPESVQDISEFLAHIHLVSCAGNVSTSQALVNVATGLYVTDSRTPIIREFCQSVFSAYPLLSRNIHRNDEWWFRHYDTRDPFPYGDYADDDSVIAHFSTVMGVTVEELLALRQWFLDNPFYVGSILPELHVVFRPSLKVSYQIYGIPFGAPEVPPPLPRIPRRERLRLHDAAMDNAVSGDATDDVFSLGSSRSAVKRVALSAEEDACFKCGETGHYAADCPSRRTCRKCGKEGHLARSCTADEERAASEILQQLGLADSPALTPRARGKASRRRE